MKMPVHACQSCRNFVENSSRVIGREFIENKGEKQSKVKFLLFAIKLKIFL